MCTFIQSNLAFLRVTELNVVFFSGIGVVCLVCTFVQSNLTFLGVTEFREHLALSDAHLHTRFPWMAAWLVDRLHHSHTVLHTPSIAFRHLPPNSARFSFATEGELFISVQLSTDAVSALRKVWVLIKTVEAT